MIRGAVVVTPQVQLPVAPKVQLPTAPELPILDPLWSDDRPNTSAPTATATYWVAPAEKAATKWRAAFVLLGGFMVLLVIAAIAAVLEASPVAPIDDGTGASDVAVSAADLRIGECFDLESTRAGTITSVTARPCDREHQYELFLRETLTLEDYPSGCRPQRVLFEEDCIPAFAEYIGASYESSVLDIYWLGPTRQSWRQGDRLFQCAVYHPSIPRLTAPLRDSGPGREVVPDI